LGKSRLEERDVLLLGFADSLEVGDLFFIEAELGKIRVGEFCKALTVKGFFEVFQRQGAATELARAMTLHTDSLKAYNCKISGSLRGAAGGACLLNTALCWAVGNAAAVAANTAKVAAFKDGIFVTVVDCRFQCIYIICPVTSVRSSRQSKCRVYTSIQKLIQLEKKTVNARPAAVERMNGREMNRRGGQGENGSECMLLTRSSK
jgi:hypothetical protein